MKKNDNIPDGLKTFCHTVWIFMGIVASLYLFIVLYELLPLGLFNDWLYDFLGMILGIILFFSIVLPFVWILITIIWCGVIAKKENNIKIFFHPAVVITNVISVIYALFIFGTM